MRLGRRRAAPAPQTGVNRIRILLFILLVSASAGPRPVAAQPRVNPAVRSVGSDTTPAWVLVGGLVGGVAGFRPLESASGSATGVVRLPGVAHFPHEEATALVAERLLASRDIAIVARAAR